MAFYLEEWSINKVIKVKETKYWGNANLKLNGIHFFPSIMNLHLTDIIDLVKHIIYTQFKRKKLLNIKKNTQINLNWRSISVRTTIVSILRLNH